LESSPAVGGLNQASRNVSSDSFGGGTEDQNLSGKNEEESDDVSSNKRNSKQEIKHDRSNNIEAQTTYSDLAFDSGLSSDRSMSRSTSSSSDSSNVAPAANTQESDVRSEINTNKPSSLSSFSGLSMSNNPKNRSNAATDAKNTNQNAGERPLQDVGEEQQEKSQPKTTRNRMARKTQSSKSTKRGNTRR
jgi:hypothetical protein